MDARLELALSLATEASEMLAALRRAPIHVGVKGLQDFVTDADRAVESLIRRRVSKSFPGDEVLGEEGGGNVGARGWVVDPIDGTINFIRGLPFFAVSIAYLEDGVPIVGVVAMPATGEIFQAVRGKGAFLNGGPVRVSACAELSRARIVAGYAQRGSREQHLAVLDRLYAAGCDVIKFNSAAVCLAMVAAGRIDGYVERELMSWDVLAGKLLVEEAGGMASGFAPERSLGERGAIVAGTRRIFDALKVASLWGKEA